MSKSSKHARDNRANQLNPTHPAFYRSRGADPDEAQQMARLSKPARDNRADQLNPNNAAHAASRGEPTASSVSSDPSPTKSE